MTISRYLINNFFLYLALFSAMLFLQIMPGFYLFDLILLTFIFYLIINRNLNIAIENLHFLSILAIFFLLPMLLSLLSNMVFSSSVEFDIKFFYYLWNTFLIYIYIIAFYNLKENIININMNFFIVAISFPLFLSVMAFISRDVMVIIKSFYGIEAFGAGGRYGGIYGVGIAGYGMLAFTVLFLSSFLYKIKKINFLVFFTAILLSLFSIILSGIRTGLIVFIALSVALYILRKPNLLSYKHLIFLILTIFSSLFYIYFAFPEIFELLERRFSIEKLLVDFQIIESSQYGSNFANLSGALDRNINYLAESWQTMFFGTLEARHDTFYVDYVVQHGLFSYLFLGIMIIYMFFKIKFFKNLKQYELFLLMLFFIGIVISIKANSMFNNYYMFSVTFIYFYLKYDNLFNKGNKCLV